MQLSVNQDNTNLPLIELRGNIAKAGTAVRVADIIRALRDEAVDRVLVSIGPDCPLSEAVAFSIIEIASRSIGVRVGFVIENTEIRLHLANLGIAKHLDMFDSFSSAEAEFTRGTSSLANLDAVILSAGQGTRMAPLTNYVAKPMLDILGQPILMRIVRHLNSFGIRNVITNPGHNGRGLINGIRSSSKKGMRFFPEGAWSKGEWVASPLGSASTLSKLARHYCAFSSEHVIVLCGDALTEINLDRMYKCHLAGESDITIAAREVPLDLVHKYGVIEVDNTGGVSGFQEKPSLEMARSQLANVGIYIFRTEILDRIDMITGLDIGKDVLETALESGLRMQVYNSKSNWLDIGCGRDYFEAVKSVLNGDLKYETPTGRNIRPGVWVEHGVEVPSSTNINGNCHIQSGSVLGQNVTISGPVSIGRNCNLQSNSRVSNSILLSSTQVQSGEAISNCIVSTKFKVDHRMAIGIEKKSFRSSVDTDVQTANTVIDRRVG